MILVTHGLVGGSVALATGNPVFGAIAAFASHFVLDMIPHWDYHLPALDESTGPLGTYIKKSHLLETFLRVGFDGIMGMGVPLVFAYIAGAPLHIVFLGSGFAILPDFLQFVYFKTHTKLLQGFMKFHTAIHSTIRFDNRPVIGITMQAVLWALSIVYIFYFVA